MKQRTTTRRQLLLGAGATVMAQLPAGAAAAAEAWLPIAPGDAGFAPDLAARLDKAVADQRLWNLHGLVVLRHDRLVLERYFEG